jgi:hypothetical protein
MTAYAAGQTFQFIASASNTGATTININSIGLKSITRDGTTALVAGDIVSGGAYQLIYDGTQFQLTNSSNASVQVTSFSAGTTGLTPSTATTGAITLGGTLNVANGGTGLTTLATSRIPYGNGTGALSSSSTFVFDGTNLGVGTATPAVKLDVVGKISSTLAADNNLTVKSTGGSNSAFMQIDTSRTTYDYGGYLYYGQGAPLWNTGAVGNGQLNQRWSLDRYNGSSWVQMLNVDTSGNLGLGVTPSAWGSVINKVVEMANGVSLSAFQTAGIASSYLTTNAYNDGTNWRYKVNFASSQYQQVGDSHNWFVAPTGTAGNVITFTQAMTLNASGNLGIGTTSPTRKLDISTTVVGNSDVIAIGNNEYGAATYLNTNSASLIFNRGSSFPQGGITASNQTSGNLSDGYLAFSTATGGALAERMRIDSSGNLGIGNSSGIARLQAYISSSTIPTCNLRQDSTANILEGAVAGGALRFVVAWTGNVTNTNNSYGAISDIKLKENIVDTSPKLDKLNKVRIVNYNLKDNPNHKQIGVIAQELEAVFPSLIEESEDKKTVTKTREVEVPAVKEVLDDEGNVITAAVEATTRTEEYTEDILTGEVTKSVKYSVFVPILIKAMQEQQAMIDELKAKVAALEAK